MVSPYTIRRISSILLFVSAIVVFVTGLLLLLQTTTVLYKYVPSNANIRMLHTYSSFIASGISIVHVYLNWNTLKRYL